MADLASRWDDKFRTGQNPWDTGRPDRALQRILEEARIKPCRTLELGCGTGTNAVFLAKQGFDVTAVDVSQVALDQARVRAREAGASVRFLQADVLELPELGPPFAFVFDRGCYQHVRTVSRERFREVLSRLTAPGTLYLMIVPNGNEEDPQLRPPGALYDYEICLEFAPPLWNLVHLREFRMDGGERDGKPFHRLCWCALLRRKR